MVDNKWKNGIPYRGTKAKLAKQILSVMPDAEHFVDVFGGGGSMSLNALDSGKFKVVHYNNISVAETTALRLLLEGRMKSFFDNPPLLDRATFHEWVKLFNTEATPTIFLGLTMWSFSNDMRSYLGSDEKAKIFLQGQLALNGKDSMFPDLTERVNDDMLWQERYAVWRDYVKDTCNDLPVNNLRPVQRLQQLERLSQLERLCGIATQKAVLDKMTFVSCDYNDLWVPEDAVVYLDPPYAATNAWYVDGWDTEAFVDWYSNLPNEHIYISGYEQLPHTEIVLEINTRPVTATAAVKTELVMKVVK